MFRLPSRRSRGHADPLQSRRAAIEWFRALPALDVIGRQAQVAAELAQLADAAAAFDLDRVAALLYLDATMGSDRRRLTRWYFEHLRRSARMADRFWEAALELGEAFRGAYGAALDAALAHPGEARWTVCRPRLTARTVYFHGAVALLRLLRGEGATPATWRQLHAVFLQACEGRCERASASLPGEDPLAARGTVEHEYLHVLLQDRLRTGNLAPAELEWASDKLHGWCGALALESQPRSSLGFYVDLAGDAGLARFAGAAQGAKVGYVDTTPLAAEIERAIEDLRAAAPEGASRPDWVRQQRIAVLEKVRPALLGSRPADLRRHARLSVDVSIDVRVGLPEIARTLAKAEVAATPRPVAEGPRGDAARSPSPPRVLRRAPPAGVEEIEIRPLPGDAWPPDPRDAEKPAPKPGAPRTVWRALDRSATGWRIRAQRDDGGARLSLGALIAVSPHDGNDWVLGVVSRLGAEAPDDVVAGVSLIASRVVPVTLYGQRKAQEAMSVVDDGVDVAAMGARFDGLYLMPPSHPDTRPAARSLIVPASEYFEGRHVILSTARAHYTVRLRKVIDQRVDWSWVTIQVAGKAGRA